MSTATTASRFQGYANEAIDRESERIRDDGCNAPALEWMLEDPERAEILGGWCQGFVHESLLARGDLGRSEAHDRLVAGLEPWVAKYVDAWTDAQREAFMAEIDAEDAESRAVDRDAIEFDRGLGTF